MSFLGSDVAVSNVARNRNRRVGHVLLLCLLAASLLLLNDSGKNNEIITESETFRIRTWTTSPGKGFEIRTFVHGALTLPEVLIRSDDLKLNIQSSRLSDIDEYCLVAREIDLGSIKFETRRVDIGLVLIAPILHAWKINSHSSQSYSDIVALIKAPLSICQSKCHSWTCHSSDDFDNSLCIIVAKHRRIQEIFAAVAAVQSGNIDSSGKPKFQSAQNLQEQ
ncbi:hypothetical protein BdWA1_001482 [Babesia duncani]|uniref:Uncharacterized protein n=1 Tax=Babesia duncani TaxID=323732 RepID=A0AAD9PPN4_9APIC|nr:hypothetical protein BdWA1_001482 [Babesia duncani]